MLYNAALYGLLGLKTPGGKHFKNWRCCYHGDKMLVLLMQSTHFLFQKNYFHRKTNELKIFKARVIFNSGSGAGQATGKHLEALFSKTRFWFLFSSLDSTRWRAQFQWSQAPLLKCLSYVVDYQVATDHFSSFSYIHLHLTLQLLPQRVRIYSNTSWIWPYVVFVWPTECSRAENISVPCLGPKHPALFHFLS